MKDWTYRGITFQRHPPDTLEEGPVGNYFKKCSIWKFTAEGIEFELHKYYNNSYWFMGVEVPDAITTVTGMKRFAGTGANTRAAAFDNTVAKIEQQYGHLFKEVQAYKKALGLIEKS